MTYRMFTGALHHESPASRLARRSRTGRMLPARTGMILSATLLLGLGALPADAQSPPDTVRADTVRADTLQSDTIPRYVVEGLIVPVPRTATSTGGVSSVHVRLDSMSMIAAPTLEEVLRALPIIQIRENSRGEAQPALRGAEDRQIAVLMDGVPLTLGWDARTDLSVVPLTAAQSVNLIRGLSSVLYGPNVLGGVVEIDVAKGDQRLREPPPITLSSSIDHEGGTSVSATAGRLFDVGRGQWLVRAGAGFRDRPGVELPDLDLSDPLQEARLTADNDQRLNSDVQKFDAFLASRYRGAKGQWISLAASGFTAERGVPPEFHESGPRLWRYPEQSRWITAISGGTGQRNTGWGVGDIEASVGVDVGSFTIEQFESLAFQTVEETEEGDDVTITLRLLAEHTVGDKTDLRTAFTYGDVSHDEVLTPGTRNEYRQRLWSAGLEIERRFDGLLGIPGLGATTLNFGGVIDGADTPESGDKPPLDGLSDWGARFGFSTLLTGESVRIHGGVSRRVRYPALRELFSGALGRFLPNPDLEPEVLTGGELGFTMNAGPTELQVVGFRQDLSDGIVRISVETAEGNLRQRVNRDRIRSTGLEVLLSGTFRRFSYNGDLTWQRVWQIDDSSDDRTRPEYEPSIAGKLSLSTALPGGVVGSGGFRFIGDQVCLNNDSGQFDDLDDSSALDLELRRVFRRGGRTLSNLDVVVAVSNARNFTVFDQCGLPQAGRTLRLQIRLF